MAANPREVVAEIKRKMAGGETLTKRDLSDLAKAARMSGHMADKVLFVNANAYREQQGVQKELTKEEKRAELVEDVKLTREKAIRTSSQTDMVEYVKAKQAFSGIRRRRRRRRRIECAGASAPFACGRFSHGRPLSPQFHIAGRTFSASGTL